MREREELSEEIFLIESALAEIYAARAGFGSVEAAENKLLRVLESDPNHLEALNLLAQLCAQTERHGMALGYLSRALTADRKMAVVLTEKLGEVYIRMGEWRQAIKVYRLGLAHQEDADLHDGLGYCYAKLGQWRKAEEHAHRAIELVPDAAVYVNDLGYMLLEQGRLEEARALFERAVSLDPSYKLAQGNLEHCLDLLSGDTGPDGQ